MSAAKKALEAKTKKGDPAAGNVTDITAALTAHRIPFETKEEAGEVHAKPPYQDTASKEFLKAKGFRWKSSDRAWVYKMAA